MKQKLTISLILVMAALFGAQAFAGVVFSVNIAPPPIAVFDQPPAPGDGYIWTPGYYQYGDYGYYWVAGQWVLPPSAGMLWTPGYWGFAGGSYAWHAGYWGPTVGFYGGVNYGNGYFGAGFNGGRWEGGRFMHNTVITNVDPRNVHNTYQDRTVVHPVQGPNHAFNGQGGIATRPNAAEQAAERAPHVAATPAQVSHAQEAHNSHLAAHGGAR
jgi:hypothetical protein